ncbi:MAG TPA: hypothetical protein VLV89_10915 [Candidatus Acidoferrum sp.]|nr:hypothetical protein [Candidatus Acidoferrum sp.]
MPVVRAQLETLFAICLVVEQPGALSLYLKDGWKKQYVRHLWMREETRNLPRVVDGLQKAMTHLDNFRPISNVTEAESQTIEMEEIGTPMPAGIEPEHIRPFPTPLGVIKATTDPNRKAMLARLYPEYQFLCGFVHFSPGTQILSSILDQRHPAAPMFSSVQREDIFQKEIAGPALWISLLSIVQSCTEFVSVYSDDVELARNLIESWNPLLEMSLLARVVWQIRSKRLLGVLL